jgi:hypothetical protein
MKYQIEPSDKRNGEKKAYKSHAYTITLSAPEAGSATPLSWPEYQ